MDKREILDWLHDNHREVWLEYMNTVLAVEMGYILTGGDTIENMLKLPKMDADPRLVCLN